MEWGFPSGEAVEDMAAFEVEVKRSVPFLTILQCSFQCSRQTSNASACSSRLNLRGPGTKGELRSDLSNWTVDIGYAIDSDAMEAAAFPDSPSCYVLPPSSFYVLRYRSCYEFYGDVAQGLSLD